MATVSKWTPYGVALDLTATAGTVTRTSATQFKVVINASWETYYNGAQTNYGMDVTSGGTTVTISKFGTNHSSGSGSLTGTYSISGNAGATKTITVTFKNYNTDKNVSASKSINLSVSVPAWTSYTVKYNANGGSGAPSSQTKWKDQALTLSSTKPTRTGYSFQGWATSASGSVTYAAGATYTTNAGVTLYAVWKANTYTVSYNANGGYMAPGNQTKTYDIALTLSSTIPTRTNYTFKGWGTSASSTTVSYQPGASYTSNASITLYAVWELSYVKPRITNLSVYRTDVNGEAQVDGTYMRIQFSWACDRTITSIGIYRKKTTEGGYDSGSFPTVSGTSGSYSTILSGFATANSYNIKVVVTDSVGSTEQTVTLNSMAFTIHGRPGGTGVAFGKMSEHDDIAEFAYSAMFTGGIRSIHVADLNDLILGGKYTFDTATLNTPYQGYGAVEVIAGPGEKTVLQIVHDLITSSSGYYNHDTSVQRRFRDGAWQPWEWINPPMKQGVEYRTIERVWGNPVYKKLIYFGFLPNATQTSVAHSISGLTTVVGCKLITNNTTKVINHLRDITYIDVTETDVLITTNANHSGKRCYVLLEYCKD